MKAVEARPYVLTEAPRMVQPHTAQDAHVAARPTRGNSLQARGQPHQARFPASFDRIPPLLATSALK